MRFASEIVPVVGWAQGKREGCLPLSERTYCLSVCEDPRRLISHFNPKLLCLKGKEVCY